MNWQKYHSTIVVCSIVYDVAVFHYCCVVLLFSVAVMVVVSMVRCLPSYQRYGASSFLIDDGAIFVSPFLSPIAWISRFRDKVALKILSIKQKSLPRELIWQLIWFVGLTDSHRASAQELAIAITSRGLTLTHQLTSRSRPEFLHRNWKGWFFKYQSKLASLSRFCETNRADFFSRVHATLQPAPSVGRSVGRSVRNTLFFCVFLGRTNERTNWAMTYTMRCTTAIVERDHLNY